MRRAVLLLCAVAACVMALPAAASSARPLAIKANKIVDDRGRQVILHGVNVVYKRAPYYPNRSGGAATSFTRADVKQLHDWGFNAIRLGVTWAGLEPQRGAIDESYLDRLSALVDLASQEDMWVLLDMHQDLYSEKFGGNGAPDWAVLDDGIPYAPISDNFALNYTTPAVGRAFTNFWADKDGIRTEFTRAIGALAERFAGSDTVLGYDLFNEPICELQLGPPCSLPPEPGAATLFLKPFYDQVVPAIQAVDDTHPVFYEDAVTVNFGWPFVGSAGGPAWPFPTRGSATTSTARRTSAPTPSAPSRSARRRPTRWRARRPTAWRPSRLSSAPPTTSCCCGA